jgi:hypothetical protein
MNLQRTMVQQEEAEGAEEKDLQGLAESPARAERRKSITGSNGLILCGLCYLLFKSISAFKMKCSEHKRAPGHLRPALPVMPRKLR